MAKTIHTITRLINYDLAKNDIKPKFLLPLLKPTVFQQLTNIDLSTTFVSLCYNPLGSKGAKIINKVDFPCLVKLGLRNLRKYEDNCQLSN